MNASISRPIETPIERQHAGKGVASAMKKFNIGLTNRQKDLLKRLPKCRDRVIVLKKSVKMTDLSALTYVTGVEFAMFSAGGRSLIIRGNEGKVFIYPEEATELSAQGYRWNGHTHPAGSRLIASLGDKEILRQFKNQLLSSIYDVNGDYEIFGKR